MIDQDMANKQLPCLIIARAGTRITHELDNIVAIKQICESNYCWLHLEGQVLSLLAASTRLGRQVEMARKADSLCIDFASWYGISAGHEFEQIPVIHAIQSVDWSRVSIVGGDQEVVSAYEHKIGKLVYDEASRTYVRERELAQDLQSHVSEASLMLPLYSFINKYSQETGLDECISQAYDLVCTRS